MQGGGLHKTNWEPELAPKYRLWCSHWTGRGEGEGMAQLGRIERRW